MASPGDIVGVISLAAQIIQIAVKFGQDWKDVPSEVRKFLAELHALKLALKELNDNVVRNPDVIAALDGRHSALLSQLGVNNGETIDKATGEDEDAADGTGELQVLVTLCGTELRKVLAELKKRSEGSRFGWERFAAAFRVKGVRQCVLDLHRECQQLNMMMTIDSIAMQAKTSLKVTELGETQQKLHTATMEELNDWREEDREVTSNLQAGVDHLTKETSDRLPMFDQLVSSHTGKEKEALIQWFSNIQADEKHTHILKNRQEGTCRYFLESPAFEKWMEGDEAKLWCIGAPGTGKTILAAAAINILEAKCVHSQVGKAFIYCNYAERSEQSIEQLLGSLIQQLLRQCKIPDHISQLYTLNKTSGKRPDANELASQLQQVIATFSTVYIVIDALDECEDVNKTRSTLLSHMKSLPSQVRILFTSRPLGEVDTLQTAQKFEVVAQAEDIHKYVVAQMARESHLVELCAKDAALERDIVDQISRKAGGMFLLVILHFRAVSSQLRLKTVRKVLSKLPVEIKDTYDDTVERIRKGQRREQSELAMNVLMLLTHAVEPLNVEQIQHALLALELDEDEEEIDTNDVYDKALLVTICGGLIVVETETSAIRFVHHTAESYFEDHDKALFDNGAETVGNMCLAYISLDDFKSRSCKDDEELDERVRSYPLYKYAATNFGRHLGPDAYNDKIIEVLNSKPLVTGMMQVLMEDVLREKGVRVTEEDLTSQSPFQAAASHGLIKVMEKFISDGLDLDNQDSFGVAALGLAILRGFPEAARMLIENGADMELRSTSTRNLVTGRTPFFFAATKGYSGLVTFMLQRGANVNAKLDTFNLYRFEVRMAPGAKRYYLDHLYMTMSWEDPRPREHLDGDDDLPAEELEKGRFEKRFDENGNRYYADHLLRRTTWTNPVHKGRTPSRADEQASGPSALCMAAFKGHEATVKVLLAAKDIDVNAEDADGRTALSLAASSGHETVVEALLDAPDIDPDIEDAHERTALSYAAAHSHLGLAIMLLEKGNAKPMSASRKHRSPLAFAVHRSQAELAKALLDSLGPDKEAAVNQRDYEMTLGWDVQRSVDGGTILYHDRIGRKSRALSPQQDQYGDHSGNDDTTGNTVLIYAAASGNPECVEMLLRAGAEVDAPDSFGRTPLMFAARNGHLDAIKVLLELGKADGSLMDLVGNTAGYYAEKEKYAEIAGLLPVVGAWGTDLSPEVVDESRRFNGESDESREREGEGDASSDEEGEGEGAAIDEQVGEQVSEQASEKTLS